MHKIPGAWVRKGRTLDTHSKHCLCNPLTGCYSERQLGASSHSTVLPRKTTTPETTGPEATSIHAYSPILVGLLLKESRSHRFQYSTALNCKQQQQRKKAQLPSLRESSRKQPLSIHLSISLTAVSVQCHSACPSVQPMDSSRNVTQKAHFLGMFWDSCAAM